MILHEYRIPYKYGDEFTLKVIADVHLGNKYCDEKAFKAYLADSDDKTYFVGLGDLLDSVITKDVKRYMKHSDATETDAIIDEQVDMACEFLEPYKDRIIGLSHGNHEHSIIKWHSTDPIARICKKLNAENTEDKKQRIKVLGYSYLLKLIFSDDGNRGRVVICRGHHGWGGGSRTQGADITKYSKDVTYYGGCNIYLYGHVHKRQSDRIDRLAWRGSKLISEPKYVVICGTFLKTFSLTADCTYSEVKGYPPVSVGGVDIKIKPVNLGVNIKVET